MNGGPRWGNYIVDHRFSKNPPFAENISHCWVDDEWQVRPLADYGQGPRGRANRYLLPQLVSLFGLFDRPDYGLFSGLIRFFHFL